MLGQKNELVEPIDGRFIPDYLIDDWLATDFNHSLLIGGQLIANCQTFIIIKKNLKNFNTNSINLTKFSNAILFMSCPGCLR